MLLQIFYYLPAILGVLFIAVGTYHGWKFRGMTRRCKVAAVGTLLGFEEKKMKSGTLYYPVVRFQTKDGQTYQARYAFGDADGCIVAAAQQQSVQQILQDIFFPFSEIDAASIDLPDLLPDDDALIQLPVFERHDCRHDLGDAGNALHLMQRARIQDPSVLSHHTVRTYR